MTAVDKTTQTRNATPCYFFSNQSDLPVLRWPPDPPTPEHILLTAILLKKMGIELKP